MKNVTGVSNSNISAYVVSCIKKYVRDDRQLYYYARRAYISTLRAYTRLSDKSIFKLKNLNLYYLAKSYGVSNVKSKGTKDVQNKDY